MVEIPFSYFLNNMYNNKNLKKMETTVKMYEDFFNKVEIYYKGAKLEYDNKHIRMKFAEYDSTIENPDGVIIRGDKTTVYDFNVIRNDNKLPYDISDMLIIILEVLNKKDYDRTSLKEKYYNIIKKFDFEIATNNNVCTNIYISNHGYMYCDIRIPIGYEEEIIYSKDINKDKEICIPYDEDSDDLIETLIKIANIASEIILHEEEINDI